MYPQLIVGRWCPLVRPSGRSRDDWVAGRVRSSSFSQVGRYGMYLLPLLSFWFWTAREAGARNRMLKAWA